MAPPATKNFRQTQPITTGLRIVCESYPANTCLRELLQNADDAGASEIEYVLDTKTYNNTPLLYEGLKEFHGPALLARNNSVFTDEDFSSLSSVGDSRKRNDATTTGKFGLGFNSVYHWTDGPWIYSRNWLLMLDPHVWWSGDSQNDGGPAWDVVEHQDCAELQNHLETFRTFDLDTSRGIQQTIIRVPLRTAAQAARSKIVNREIAVDEIKVALEQFAEEMREGGLLFLKHVRSITLRIDNETISKIKILEEGSDLHARHELPLDFKRLYVPQIPPVVQQDTFKSLSLRIEFSRGTYSCVQSYLIQHTMMMSSGDHDLDDWARQRKLFPWTAVAVLLDQNLSETSFCGRLYCALRMPILINHPAHIHGLWAITPDRSRLSSSGQSSGYQDESTRWNNFMFQTCVSLSWAKLLLHRSHASWNEERFGLWPQVTSSPAELWGRLDEWVIDTIISQRLPVWNAQGKCVDIASAHLFLDGTSNGKYVSAIASVMPSAVFLGEALLNKVIGRSNVLQMPKQVATPSSVRLFLRQAVPVIQAHIAPLLLEYCLLGALKSELQGGSRSILYEGFQGIPFWPNVGGGFSAAGHLLLPRDEEEMDLFKAARGTETLDLKRMAPPLLKLLWKDIGYISALMRLRTISDLSTDWPLIYPISQEYANSASLLGRNGPLEATLKNTWDWIFKRYNLENANFPPACYELWILPVKNSRVRKLAPSSRSPLMLVPRKADSLYQLMVEIGRGAHAEAPPILDIDALSADALKFLRKEWIQMPRFHGAALNDFGRFVSWLAASREIIAAASEQEKNSVLQHLESLAMKSNFSFRSDALVRDSLKTLPIFNKVECSAPFHKRALMRSDLTGYEYPLMVPENLPPLPQIQDVAFFDLSDRSEKYLAESFSLMGTMSLETLLRNHLLPWALAADGRLGAVKDSLIDFIFSNDHSRNPSRSWIELIANHPIIPILAGKDKPNGRHRCLVDLVRPQTLFSKLFFEDEDVIPEPSFFRKHETALVLCGIKSDPTWADLVGRICYFSQRPADAADIIEKVKILLTIPPPSDFEADEPNIHRIQTLKWVPGIPVLGTHVSLLSPQDCRGQDQRSLTVYVLGSTTLSPSGNWRKILGWDKPFHRSLLFRQLDICLERNDHEKVQHILSYLKPNEYSEIKYKKCILGSRKQYWGASKVFLPNSFLSRYPMLPFLDEVDSLFAQRHRKLIEILTVRSQPSMTDLIEVQKILQGSAPLDQPSLDIAVNSLEVAIRLPQTDDLTNTLVPDSQSVLRNVWDIVHGDRNVTGAVAAFHYTHPMISTNVIERLGVENALARATRLAIEFDDEDEDEYTLEEKLTDIISDTLGRYSMESTFNEYLANADDCGATKISWILDECKKGHYESKALLTPELEAFQGASLMVHNDGVFSEEDFNGLKAIGRGGKGDTSTSTGMFGRGALSMYHFTDVPMIISGDHFLALDPQQNFLPRNKRQRRKVGVKITLSTARRICADHLAPFHGVCGFSSDMDHYDGTLFRFPFRGTKPTRLKEHDSFIESEKTKSLLDKYFEDASMALLFLRNIKSVDLFIRGEDHARWCVSASRSEVSEDEIFRQLKIKSQNGKQQAVEKIWRVGMTDIVDCPSNIVKPGRGAAKITECGIAACISHPKTSQRIFCTLPTPFRCCIPISFHASFAVTGDRKSIPFEDVRRDPIIAEWNNWLLTDCIPGFYLEFLKDLAPRLGDASFQYWPLTTEQPTNLTSAVIEAFWKKISDNDAVTVYPLARSMHASNDASPLKIRSSGKVRKLYATTSLRTAQFDALSDDKSSKLGPLFLKICPFLVNLPYTLGCCMRKSEAGKSMTILGAEFLCSLFRKENNCKILEEFYAQGRDSRTGGTEAMELLMGILVETAGTNPEALNYLGGCRILPKLDGSLGLLTLGTESGTEWNLIADKTEQKLFGFAAGSFVNTNLFQRPSRLPNIGFSIIATPRNPIKAISESKLNVRPLELQDVGRLLTRKDSPLHQMDGKNRASWTEKFWAYLNSRLCAEYAKASSDDITLNLLTPSGLQDKPIYRVDCNNGQEKYCTPTQFDSEAWIVDPSTDEHHALCLRIKDLRLADRSCLPFLLVTQEDNLSAPRSFHRLIKAFKVIERRSKISITAYLDQILTEENRQVLRTELIRYLKDNAAEAEIMSTLRALPVWPCHNNLGKVGISADMGICCRYPEMLMPWMKNLANFIRPDIVENEKRSLLALGCKIMTIRKTWQHVVEDFPSSLEAVNSAGYRNLLRKVASAGLEISEEIAPNGNGIFCNPSSLYDCNDQIFSAAFRHREAHYFLHKDLRGRDLDTFWKSRGLRARPTSGDIDGADYLKCAMEIKYRLSHISNPENTRDAATVATYLYWDSPSLHKWTDNDWSKLSEVGLFAVADGGSTPLAYRRPRMQELAQKKSHCSLQELGREADRRIIWSQKPFAEFTPAPYAFERIPSGGCPTAKSVFYHLTHLIGMRRNVNTTELVEYLRDIQASYTYLQDHAEDTREIPCIRSAEIWINLDTSDVDKINIDDISLALCPVRLLCMNCPSDPLPLKVVRKFLIPYEKLLAILGCQAVIQPPKGPKRPTGNIGLPMVSAMKQIQKFRQVGAFVDIIFQAEGREKPAHKIFMAAVSEYCRVQFTGEWGQLLRDKTVVIELDDIKFKALSQMVDFAYTGEIEFRQVTDRANNDEIAERLDDLLDLLRSTDRWILEYLHQLTEDHVIDHSDLYVRPDNVTDVLVIAKEVRARRLVSHCEAFIENNQSFVEAFEHAGGS